MLWLLFVRRRIKEPVYGIGRFLADVVRFRIALEEHKVPADHLDLVKVENDFTAFE